MIQSLQGKSCLILVSNGVDEKVMSILQRDLMKTGAELKTVSTASGLVNSWNGKGWGIYFTVDANVNVTLGSDFDMLVVPSGKLSVEKLAESEHTARIISSFAMSGKPMAFLGNASSLLDSDESNAFVANSVENVEQVVSDMVSYFMESLSSEEDMQKAA